MNAQLDINNDDAITMSSTANTMITNRITFYLGLELELFSSFDYNPTNVTECFKLVANVPKKNPIIPRLGKSLYDRFEKEIRSFNHRGIRFQPTSEGEFV